MFKNFFKEHGAKDVITLFHAPKSPSSTRVLTFLKQANASASETATGDQASSHGEQSAIERVAFELDVTEAPPTSDQLRSILDYVGGQNANKVIKGARDEADALSKLKQDAGSFQRPLVVDWNQGKAVVGDSQSEILNLLKSIPK